MIYIYNIIFISNQWSAQSHSKFDQNETRVPRAARFFSLPRSISPVTSPSHWNPTLATRFRLLQMLVLKLLQVLQRETESEIDSGQTLTWYVNDVFVATNEEIRSSAKYLFCQCLAKGPPKISPIIWLLTVVHIPLSKTNDSLDPLEKPWICPAPSCHHEVRRWWRALRGTTTCRGPRRPCSFCVVIRISRPGIRMWLCSCASSSST